MSRRQRSNTILGLLLILAGAAFLAQRFYPNLRIWDYFTFSWPWYVIGAGALLLLLGLLVGAPGMAVPAADRRRDRRLALLAECDRQLG